MLSSMHALIELLDRREKCLEGAEGTSMSAGRFLVISGHDYRSKRKASLHFIADCLKRRGKVSIYSPGFSHLSRMAADIRLDLWPHANKVEQSGGVDCYLERTFIHPFNTAQGWLSSVENRRLKIMTKRPRPQLVEWIKQADTVILKSGLPLLFAEQIARINPAAKMIYLASDDLRTIGCSSYLIDCLHRAAPSFDHAVLPSKQLARTMPPIFRLLRAPRLQPRRFPGPNNLALCGSGQRCQRWFHAVRRQVLQDGVPRVPEVKFHIIGGGRRSRRVTEPNATVLPEMAFHETVRYIVHASIGIAAYDKATTPYYLSDTSMKLAQYAFAGLNSVCPLFAAGGKPGRFGYEFIRSIKHCRSFARRAHHPEGSARRFRVFELVDVTDRSCRRRAFPTPNVRFSRPEAIV